MTKPFTLTPLMISLLRGEATYTQEGKAIVEAGKLYYQDGRDGLPYEHIPAPANVSAAAAELVERFLLACWELGEQDSIPLF